MVRISEALSERINLIKSRIGNTPITNLGSGIYGKVEGLNPAGSIKDRAAFYILKAALESGELRENGTVTEATSGNTGIGIAYAARELGLRAVICMPDNMSAERRKMISDYGAELVLTPASEGMAGAVAAAERIRGERGAFIANQFGNPASIEAHFRTTAPELFKQLPSAKYVVCGVGSGGTAMGFAKYISENGLDCRVIGVEPSSSPLLTKGYFGAHKIQGIGANFVPQILDGKELHGIIAVEDEKAMACVKELYKVSGYKCGISSAAAYLAAKRLRAEVDGDIAVILPDNGERYSEELYI